MLRARRGRRPRAARLVGDAGHRDVARFRLLRRDPVRVDLVVAGVRRRGDRRGVAGGGRDRERRLLADLRPARDLAGAAAHVSARARRGADRRRRAHVGRVRGRGPPHDRAARRTALAHGAHGRRRRTRAPHGVRDQQDLAADDEACGAARRGARRQAGAARRADRGSAHRARADPRARRDDAASAGHGHARTLGPERRPGAGVAHRGTRGSTCPTRSSRRSPRRTRRARSLPARSTHRRWRSARRALRRSRAPARAASGTRASGAS